MAAEIVRSASMNEESKESGKKLCTPKASSFEEVGLEQSQTEGQGSKHDWTPQSKLDALPLSKRFKSLSIEGNSVTPHQGKNVKGGWETQKRKRLLKTIIGDVLREDEDNELAAAIMIWFVSSLHLKFGDKKI